MYRLTQSGSVIRLSDSVFIPVDDKNGDYRAYLAWVAAGNTADPYVPPPPDPDLPRQAAIRQSADRIELLNQLKTATSAQIETFIRTRLNADAVTNLATAILFCKRVETAIVQLTRAIALDQRT